MRAIEKLDRLRSTMAVNVLISLSNDLDNHTFLEPFKEQSLIMHHKVASYYSAAALQPFMKIWPFKLPFSIHSYF